MNFPAQPRTSVDNPVQKISSRDPDSCRENSREIMQRTGDFPGRDTDWHLPVLRCRARAALFPGLGPEKKPGEEDSTAGMRDRIRAQVRKNGTLVPVTIMQGRIPSG